MKYEDIANETLRSVVEGLDHGRLLVDIPNDGKAREAYGFIKVKLDENISTVMVCNMSLGRDENASLISDILDNKEGGRFYSTFYINERTGDLLVNVHSGIGHGFFIDYFGDRDLDAIRRHELIAALNEDAHALMASSEEVIVNAVSAHLIDSTNLAKPRPETDWFNAYGRPCSEYASMASAFIEGRSFDIESECANIARSKVHEETIESLTLGKAFTNRTGIIDSITDKVLSKTVSIRVDDRFESVPWTDEVAKTIASEAIMFEVIRKSPSIELSIRRDLFAALTEAFPPECCDDPKTVKVTVEGIEAEGVLTLEYKPLLCSLYSCDSTIYAMHFAAKDRVHLEGSVSPTDILSVAYRGKTVYEKSS